MLNLHCDDNDKTKQNKKNIKKLCGHRDSNPGYMPDSKTTVVSTTLWSPMALLDKNNEYTLKL